MVEGSGGGEEGIRSDSKSIEHPERTDPGLVQSKIPDTGGISQNLEPESPETIEEKSLLEGFLAGFNKGAPNATFKEQAFYHCSNVDEVSLKKGILDLQSTGNDIKAREVYGYLAFALIVLWLLGIYVFLWFLSVDWQVPNETRTTHYWKEFKLSDAVVIALLGTTTVNVLGIFVIVAKYIFPDRVDRTDKK